MRVQTMRFPSPPGTALRHLAAASLAVPLAAGCATIQTRPAERMPWVEVEINNTASVSDDYVPPAGSPARVRIANPQEAGGDYPVELRNMSPATGGQLFFGATGATASLGTLSVTLPASGEWVPFAVAPHPRNVSARDKDAVIEVRETRRAGTVLARRALMAGSTVTPTRGPAVEIQIQNSAATVDDYVGWAPAYGRIRLAAPARSDQFVALRNMDGARGQLRFAEDRSPWPAGETATLPTLGLTLPADGEWVFFRIAGHFGSPSVNDKDAVIEVIGGPPPGGVLGREAVMVRVRKNAERLTAGERDRFLQALATLNLQTGNYEAFQDVHAVAGTQAHKALASEPAHGFLPWHRTLLVRLERELQALDPAVALPYWKFDAPAPGVFHPDFMGSTPAGESRATVSPTNPLFAWRMGSEAGIVRSPGFRPNARASLNDELTTLGLGEVYDGFRRMEINPHDPAHPAAGGPGGWLSQLGTAVKDPLFFLLHANVDRLWARWQSAHAHLAATSTGAYALQGAHPSTGRCTATLGHYALDSMWPWNQATHPGDACRPHVAPGGSFPPGILWLAPPPHPRPRDVIDFRNLGIDYDDVPFR